MWNVSGRLWFSCCLSGLLAATAAAQNPTFSLVPVDVNGATPTVTRACAGGPNEGAACSSAADCDGSPECARFCVGGSHDGDPCTGAGDCPGGACDQPCTCNHVITANPGDVITNEIIGSNWSPQGEKLRAWQVRVDGSGFGDATLLPLAWDHPRDTIECPCEEHPDCTPECGAICYVPLGVTAGACAGPNHNPPLGGYIEIPEKEDTPCPPYCSRPDYVFQGLGELRAVDLSTLSYAFASTLLNPLDAPQYSSPKYFGTLILVLSDSACGTINVPLLGDGESFYIDDRGLFIEPLDVEGLTIDTGGACPCDGILASTPLNCSIDPAQPSEPDGSSPAGWDSVELEFYPPECNTRTLGVADLEVRQVPFGFPFIGIDSLEPNGNLLTVRFNRIISPERWTCVTYVSGVGQACLGSLPGDSDEDAESLAGDVPAIVSCLESGPCQTLRCDIDRSGRCAPADILREIDLLNGAETYSAWLGATLGNCPSGGP